MVDVEGLGAAVFVVFVNVGESKDVLNKFDQDDRDEVGGGEDGGPMDGETFEMVACAVLPGATPGGKSACKTAPPTDAPATPGPLALPKTFLTVDETAPATPDTAFPTVVPVVCEGSA